MNWRDDAGAEKKTSMTLAWVDYNHWSASGSDEPSRVAEAVLRFWLNHSERITVPDRFDAALVRRRFSEADDVIPQMIG